MSELLLTQVKKMSQGQLFHHATGNLMYRPLGETSGYIIRDHISYKKMNKKRTAPIS